jgi:hypothetical protein
MNIELHFIIKHQKSNVVVLDILIRILYKNYGRETKRSSTLYSWITQEIRGSQTPGNLREAD